MGRRTLVMLVAVVCLLGSLVLPASASLSELLLGGTRVYTTAGITVVVEGWLRPELMSDPAAYLAFWALRSDQPVVQASAQHLQGGVVIPRGNTVKVKIFIEPGNGDFDRTVLVHQYAPSAKFGMREIAKFQGMYREIILDSSSDLQVGCNAIRIYLAGKGRNRHAYLGVGIVVAPNPADVKRQAELVSEAGQSEYLVPQQPVRQEPIPPTSPTSGESEPAVTGTVVVKTTHPATVRVLVDGKECITREVRDRRIFENVPVGQVSMQVKNASQWQVRGSVSRLLAAGRTVQFDLERRTR